MSGRNLVMCHSIWEKGNTVQCANYRGTSLLSISGKLMNSALNVYCLKKLLNTKLKTKRVVFSGTEVMSINEIYENLQEKVKIYVGMWYLWTCRKYKTRFTVILNGRCFRLMEWANVC